MKALAATACLFCLALPAQAQGLPAAFGDWNPFARRQPPHPAVVRVVAPEGEGSLSLGSGTLVAVTADKGLIVTNWHVVKDSKMNPRVIFPDGFQSAGAVLKIDADWDLAAIAIWRPKVEPVPLANEPPRPGDALTIAGYGSGTYRAAAGACVQYLSPGRNMPPDIIEMSAKARQGDSGGPILNGRGELAGVLFGEGGGKTSGSHCRRVRWFLGPLIATSSQPLPRRSPPPPSPETALPLAAVPREVTRPPAAAAPQDPAPPAWRDQISSFERAPTEPFSAFPSRATAGLEEQMAGPLYQERLGIDAPLPPEPAPWDWRQLTGTTPLEKTKTALAAVGAIALLLQIANQMKPPPKPAEATPAK